MFDLSHVTDVGMQGSAGPPVSMWDMVRQGFRQQYRVDSAMALDEELRTRWLESLQAMRTTGQNFSSPVDPLMYRGFARFVREGTPVTVPTVEGEGYGARFNPDVQQPHREFEEMRRANEAIRALNNPNIKTFEQILEEVSAMQRGVEEQTASMSERGGVSGFVGELIGAIGGSFTPRDPLNIVTAPIGAGRTIAARIGTDMLIAAGVVTATEYGDVQPNRALAELPDRNPLFNITAATLGAGIIRGGIEGAGAGIRNVRGRFATEEIDFDLRDSQLRQMFDNAPDTPTTRAGLRALDDAAFIERNNPYGDGQAAQARFLAELQDVQRAMGGEPMTAVARVLPPLPFEYIKKAADFEIVREQRPLVYARMEQAQARLSRLSGVDEPEDMPLVFQNLGRFAEKASSEQRGARELWMSPDEYTALALTRRNAVAPRDEPVAKLQAKIEEEGLKSTPYLGLDDMGRVIEQEGLHRAAALKNLGYEQIPVRIYGDIAKLRKAANAEYQTAYRAVEAEAVRLREAQARIEAAQQREAVHIFADATRGRPFNWSALQYDHVQARVDAINAFNDTLDERAVAQFAREAEGEAAGREAWRTEDGRIDIGLQEPVDPEFRITTDDGDMSIAQVMRDLQDDADLDEAMRICLR